jgi:hemoglobin
MTTLEFAVLAVRVGAQIAPRTRRGRRRASPTRHRHILGGVTAVADISTREDCERLVRAFYGKALGDPIIGYLFTDIAKLDLEAHVPKIASFWETVLLGAHSYRGGAFAPHAVLHMKAPLQRGHFERWLWLWHATVDELFAGARADLAKSHANRVASAFHGRLEAMSAAMAVPSGQLVVSQHG